MRASKGGDVLGKVQKRAGTQEEFQREKIERAVRMAGAAEPVAMETARAVETRFRDRLQGETAVPTHEIRMSVLDELRRRDSKTARAFEEHTKHQH